MTTLVVFCVAAALGIAAFVLALTGSQRAEKRDRVSVWMVGMLLLVAISPWLLWFGLDHELPVKAPAEPWHGEGGCHDSSDPPWPVVIFVYLVIRSGPAPWMALFTRRTIDARRVFRLAAWAVAIVGALAAVRLAIGGADGRDFTTYGALTPAHAGGWRADLLLDTLGERHDILEADPIDHELTYTEGSREPFPSPGYTTAHGGAQVWIGERPALFYDDSGEIVGAYVTTRDPAMIPPERRPHFAEWPRIARLDRAHQVLLGRGADGGLLAVKVNNGGDVEAATDGDAWVFAAPPWQPMFAAAVLALIGVVAVRYYQARLFASWLFLEATVALLYAYTRFVCGS